MREWREHNTENGPPAKGTTKVDIVLAKDGHQINNVQVKDVDWHDCGDNVDLYRLHGGEQDA